MNFRRLLLGLIFAQFRLDVDAFFGHILTLYIVQMLRMYTCQDYCLVRFLAVVGAALALLILRIDSPIAPNAPNETFHGVITLEKWT